MKDSVIAAAEKSILFQNVKAENIGAMIDCMECYLRRYGRGDVVLNLGDAVTKIGLVVSGELTLSKTDYRGNETLYSKISPGMIFGEAMACLGVAESDIQVTAVTDTEVLFLDLARVTRTCSSACAFHQQVVRNLLICIADKNRKLSKKMEHMSKRTTREKLLSYLCAACDEGCGEWFTIPLNRQELADYLCVERSAMSWELCKMRDEGILNFKKNHFCFSPDFSCKKSGI